MAMTAAERKARYLERQAERRAIKFDSVREFLMYELNAPGLTKQEKIKLALQLLPGEDRMRGGLPASAYVSKKAQAAEAARGVAVGRYAPRNAPKLVVNNK